MSKLDFNNGDLIAKAIDKRIKDIVVNSLKNIKNDKTVYGIIKEVNKKKYKVLINKKEYSNVYTLRHVGVLKVGERVICEIPNNNYSDMYIVGVLDY